MNNEAYDNFAIGEFQIYRRSANESVKFDWISPGFSEQTSSCDSSDSRSLEIRATEDEKELFNFLPPSPSLARALTWRQEWQPRFPNWPNCPYSAAASSPRFLCPVWYFPAIGIRRVFAVAGLQNPRPRISDFNFIPA